MIEVSVQPMVSPLSQCKNKTWLVGYLAFIYLVFMLLFLEVCSKFYQYFIFSIYLLSTLWHLVVLSIHLLSIYVCYCNGCDVEVKVEHSITSKKTKKLLEFDKVSKFLSNNWTFNTMCAAAYISTSVSINNNNGNFSLSIQHTLHQQLRLVGTS